jgi:predicted lipid-binding transport protein (Tim44 family)
MALALFGPARLILQTVSRDMGRRAQVEIAKLVLGMVAVGLLMSAGIMALTQAVGYPIAATVFATILGLLALVVHLLGRAQAARQSQHMASAQARLRSDIALLAVASRSALPLLPVMGFLAAFLLARRR